MTPKYLKQMQEIIRDVEKFIYDEAIPPTQIASYVVGHTMMRDDYWDIIEAEDQLREFAEMGANTEVLGDDYEFIESELKYLRSAFERLKAKYGTGEKS